MSTLKVNRTQLGQSNTVTQNFTLDASASDGTMKLARGNAGATTQDVITVDNSGKVSFPSGSDIIGVGQTWQNVGASRALGTTYTNSTGKPIFVLVTLNAGSAASSANLTINGTAFQIIGINAGSQVVAPVSFIVPAGGTYAITQVTGSVVIQGGVWMELR